VSLLLNRSDLDANRTDSSGFTPLGLALVRGDRIGTLRLLIASGRVSINCTDVAGKTPLHLAIKSNREYRDEIVALLLERSDIDANREDRKGFTPLWLAFEDQAGNGCPGVLPLLIASEKVDVNHRNSHGRTLLHVLCGALTNCHGREKYIEATTLLLQRPDLDVNARDEGGNTPLIQAIHQADSSVVALLTVSTSLDINCADIAGETPLHLAVKSSYGKNRDLLVSLLLQCSDLDANRTDGEGLTPLWRVMMDHHRIGTLRVLIPSRRVDINCLNLTGKTPLHLVVEDYGTDRAEIASLLLKRSDVHANRTDTEGLTPLWRAFKRGDTSVLRLLVASEKVDIHCRNLDGNTLLHVLTKGYYSCGNKDYEEIVRLLIERQDADPRQSREREGKLRVAGTIL